jgi:Flp pilus assembly protein TadD
MGCRLARASLVLIGGVILVASSRAVAAEDPHQAECDLGIALALEGQPAQAESVFISLLSHSPRDSRALTNLGNLHLLRGETEVALTFYGQAGATDSMDAGIVLNEATALLLLGDEEAAQERARLGMRMAGGALSAASLLGLRYEGPETEAAKGAERTYLSKEEVLALLRAAAGHVPADSAKAAGTAGSAGRTQLKKRAPVWRSAGPRASEGEDSAALVYWKR